MNTNETVEKAFWAGHTCAKQQAATPNTEPKQWLENVKAEILQKQGYMKDIEAEYDFQQVVEPVMDWINKYGNPHMKVIIDCNLAELLSGEYTHKTDAFIRD